MQARVLPRAKPWGARSSSLPETGGLGGRDPERGPPALGAAATGPPASRHPRWRRPMTNVGGGGEGIRLWSMYFGFKPIINKIISNHGARSNGGRKGGRPRCKVN